MLIINALALLLGAACDAILGDPRGWPHPVRAIGGLIARSERTLRDAVGWLGDGAGLERSAGAILMLWVVSITGVTVWGVVAACDVLGTPGALCVRTVLVYWGLAARSLTVEASMASEAPNLATARRELSQIVGRDTADLDWPEIHRACVETIGENTNDGTVAPIFWYAIAGPVGLWLFKAVSTLDSMVGYRDERYLHLGWASARLDDLLNLLPARLTWLLFALAALPGLGRARGALAVGWRDGRKHPSPNSAWGEAALAGALGVELGGPSTYRGVERSKPRIGETLRSIDASVVHAATRLSTAVMMLTVGLGTGGLLLVGSSIR